MKHYLIIIGSLLALAGCATTTDYDPYVTAIDNQLQARSYQTRQIEDTDYNLDIKDDYFRI